MADWLVAGVCQFAYLPVTINESIINLPALAWRDVIEQLFRHIFQTWQSICRDLLEVLLSREDSEPFRHPVNLDDYPVRLHPKSALHYITHRSKDSNVSCLVS